MKCEMKYKSSKVSITLKINITLSRVECPSVAQSDRMMERAGGRAVSQSGRRRHILMEPFSLS